MTADGWALFRSDIEHNTLRMSHTRSLMMIVGSGMKMLLEQLIQHLEDDPIDHSSIPDESDLEHDDHATSQTTSSQTRSQMFVAAI